MLFTSQHITSQKTWVFLCYFQVCMFRFIRCAVTFLFWWLPNGYWKCLTGIHLFKRVVCLCSGTFVFAYLWRETQQPRGQTGGCILCENPTLKQRFTWPCQHMVVSSRNAACCVGNSLPIGLWRPLMIERGSVVSTRTRRYFSVQKHYSACVRDVAQLLIATMLCFRCTWKLCYRAHNFGTF
jgi:hypothetical protein